MNIEDSVIDVAIQLAQARKRNDLIRYLNTQNTPNMQKVLWAGLMLFLIATTQHAQETELIVEPNHSTISFRIDIAGFTAVTGKFTDFTIEAIINEKDFAKSSFSAVIQVESINTGICSLKDRGLF